MPAGGQTTDISVVGTWLVRCGDKVKRGDALLEIETDKATLTVESYAKGIVLALLAEEGDRVPAGEVIALIGEEGDRKEAEALIAGRTAQSAAGADEAVRQNQILRTEQEEGSADKPQEKEMLEEEEYQPIDRRMQRRRKDPVKGANDAPRQTLADSRAMNMAEVKAMPNAKLMAKENHISLADVAEGLGKHILKRQDVEAYLESIAPGRLSAGGAADEGTTENTGAKAPIPEVDGDITVPFTNMRQIIARRMLESVQSIPVFTVTVEIDMTQCIALRGIINSSGDDRKVSYNDILFKCMEAAIRSYPYVNASCKESEIILHRDVNIGLAVSVEGGLVVPVVHKVQEKNISGISICSREKVKKARAGKLAPEDMSGGTITLSNLGMYPVTQFTAIINPPQVCILAVGAIEEKVVFKEGAQKSVPVMKVTGSFDHRVIDGAYGAGFLTELKKITENPALALL